MLEATVEAFLWNDYIAAATLHKLTAIRAISFKVDSARLLIIPSN